MEAEKHWGFQKKLPVRIAVENGKEKVKRIQSDLIGFISLKDVIDWEKERERDDRVSAENGSKCVSVYRGRGGGGVQVRE